MPKDLGGLLAAKLRDDRIAPAHYLKMVWGAPTGTLRWTTYINPKHPQRYDNRNIDGALQDWDSDTVFDPKGLQESDQSSLTISDITFGNADRTFTDRMTLSAGGLRAVTVTLWTAFFNKDDLTLFDSKFTRFVGVFDRAEAGTSVHVSLLAGKHPMHLVFPLARFNAAHGYPWIPPPGLIDTWGTGTYGLPAASPRQTGTGGGGEPPPYAPPPGGFGGGGGRMPIVRVTRDRETRTVGPGRDPRVVTR